MAFSLTMQSVFLLHENKRVISQRQISLLQVCEQEHAGSNTSAPEIQTVGSLRTWIRQVGTACVPVPVNVYDTCSAPSRV